MKDPFFIHLPEFTAIDAEGRWVTIPKDAPLQDWRPDGDWDLFTFQGATYRTLHMLPVKISRGSKSTKQETRKQAPQGKKRSRSRT